MPDVGTERNEGAYLVIQFSELKNRNSSVAVVGLGYVGLPLAVALSEHFDVIGLDLNERKIQAYLEGKDPTREVGDEAVAKCSIHFTTNPSYLNKAKFIIVAVPTPVNGDKTPDLSPIIGASELVGSNMSEDTVVVFESTVYPGVTEDICGPILAEKSGYKLGEQFFIGYSPERINPGDKVHRLHNIRKIVSGMNDEVLDVVDAVYSTIIQAGTYRASNIKVAEAAKVAENSQRDINIAFMNELAKAFDRMGISTNEVVDAMNTKWNAMGFRPGLVGGHCIGVDPYYFLYQAEKLGFHSQIIAAGRRINDGMSNFVVDRTIKELIRAGVDVSSAKIVLLGMTFKENCVDTRNSRSIDVYNGLMEYGVTPVAVDPVADADGYQREYGISLASMEQAKNADCLVFLVAHDEFKGFSADELKALYNEKQKNKVLIDVKGIFSRVELERAGFRYWSL